MIAKRRLFYWVIPVVIFGAALLIQSCGDDDGDEFCSDIETVASEELCEALADDNDCDDFTFTAPDSCELDGCDCVNIVDDVDVFDD